MVFHLIMVFYYGLDFYLLSTLEGLFVLLSGSIEKIVQYLSCNYCPRKGYRLYRKKTINVNCIDYKEEKNDQKCKMYRLYKKMTINAKCINYIKVTINAKCIDYIKKNDHKWSLFYIIYTFCHQTLTSVESKTINSITVNNLSSRLSHYSAHKSGFAHA